MALSENQIFALLKDAGCKISPCGSRVTCSPAPTDTDRDFLVLVPFKQTVLSKLVETLRGDGFNLEGRGEHYQDSAVATFFSLRRDDLNLIMTANERFAQRHGVATALCRRLNLMNKGDRIALFQAVLYGN